MRLLPLLGFAFSPSAIGLQVPLAVDRTSERHAQVLILGGGMTGIVAARTLHQQGIHDSKIVEARDEIGGRMMSTLFGSPSMPYRVEVGANWIHGTQSGDGPANPIFELARKHNISLHANHYHSSMTTFDYTGQVDYLDVFNASVDAFTRLCIAGGGNIPRDATSRFGYSFIGTTPLTHQELAAEYYQFDWEYAQTPEMTSWAAAAWAANLTFNIDQGGFSSENLLSIDQRGFASILQAEAAEFLTNDQILLSTIVKTIQYSDDGVSVVLEDGSTLSADHVLVTFSLGVLQNDDVIFEPTLPRWKTEAIHGMSMGTYTKVYLQFPEKFWFDTEFALFADKKRGWYPVWQDLDTVEFFPGSGIVFVTVTGEFSKRIEALSDDQVEGEVLSVLQLMYPEMTIPEPEAFYFPRWFSDPLYRGSYSNWPGNLTVEDHENIRASIGNRLWFAGEATSRKYFGYLHGAYYEGQETAGLIARCIKAHSCHSLSHPIRQNPWD